MKNYTITVNGKAYDVSVEEKGGTASAPAAAAVKQIGFFHSRIFQNLNGSAGTYNTHYLPSVTYLTNSHFVRIDYRYVMSFNA